MEKSKKLEKIVEFAISKGWKTPFPETTHYPIKFGKAPKDSKKNPGWTYVCVLTEDISLHQTRKPFGTGTNELFRENYYKVLFSHEFAKAVFGELVVCAHCGTMWMLPSHCCGLQDIYDLPDGFKTAIASWELGLKQAVIAEDPVDYYYNFIKQHGKTNKTNT